MRILGLLIILILLPVVRSEIFIDYASTVNVGEYIDIVATFYLNGSEVCDAECYMGGGWIENEMYMSIENCTYHNTIMALYTGIFNFYVRCEHQNGEDIKNFSVTVEKAHSTLSIEAPSTSRIGESVKIIAYYNDKNGNIIDGECSVDVKMNNEILYSATMKKGLDHYFFYYTPKFVGTYTFFVECRSDNFKERSGEKTINVLKMEAKLIQTIQGNPYYGNTVYIIAYYTHKEKLIDGKCYLSYGDQRKEMKKGIRYYYYTFNVPFNKEKITIYVECSSNMYESKRGSIEIEGIDIPTSLNLFSNKIVYAHNNETFSIVYKDYKEMKIDNAMCSVYVNGKYVNAEELNKNYIFEFNFDTDGEHTITVECWKDFFEKAHDTFSLYVEPMPIFLTLKASKDEYRVGEEISISIDVVDIKGRSVDVNCNARVEYYNKITGMNEGIDFLNNIGSTIKLEAKEPVNMNFIVKCSGNGFESVEAKKVVSIKLFTKKIEENITIVLGITTLLLIIVIKKFLIRKT